ncbi:MAG: hypothetical protein ACQEVA_04500, partial [Myxococcota bacterium]
SVDSAPGELRVTRSSRRLTVAPNPLANGDMTALEDRHAAFCVLTGARLGLDRLSSDYQPGQTSTQPNRPLRYHEQPSIYGERLPRLLPRIAVHWFEAISGVDAFVTDWEIDEIQQVYVLETGKHLHTLAASDLPAMEEDPDKIRRNGRHALFYDSYKLKPRHKKRYSSGLVRIFRSVEGLGASRAVLLPDFDYDAAREGGSFAIPCRDTMIIGRPDDSQDADEMAGHVREHAAVVLRDALFPLCNRVWRMTDKTVDDSTEFGDTALPLSGQKALAPGEFTISVEPL